MFSHLTPDSIKAKETLLLKRSLWPLNFLKNLKNKDLKLEKLLFLLKNLKANSLMNFGKSMDITTMGLLTVCVNNITKNKKLINEEVTNPAKYLNSSLEIKPTQILTKSKVSSKTSYAEILTISHSPKNNLN